MFQSSRMNDHSHHQQQMTPTKMSFHHNNSQDNHGFYNQPHMNYGGNQFNNNNFGAGTSNNFYQHQNIGHYSVSTKINDFVDLFLTFNVKLQQGQQHQQNWNQQQYFR
jgi:hypothetical protein